MHPSYDDVGQPIGKTNPLTVHIAPSVRRCEELARQAKPPAPPSLQTLGQQARWGRRFRLPGRPEANFSQLLSAGLYGRHSGCATGRKTTVNAFGFLEDGLGLLVIR